MPGSAISLRSSYRSGSHAYGLSVDNSRISAEFQQDFGRVSAGFQQELVADFVTSSFCGPSRPGIRASKRGSGATPQAQRPRFGRGTGIQRLDVGTQAAVRRSGRGQLAARIRPWYGVLAQAARPWYGVLAQAGRLGHGGAAARPRAGSGA